MNIYFKRIYINTGEITCILTGYHDINAALLYINRQKTNRDDIFFYEYVPNSCVKKLFGSDTFGGHKRWPK
jgi:hypothetical protein